MKRKRLYEKAGRPKAKIDWDKVAIMLQAQSKSTEIAGYYGIDRKTLYNRCIEDNNVDFSTFKEQNRKKGKQMLRTAMYKNALNGSNALQIWLSKQYLNQREPQEKNKKLEIEMPKIEIITGKNAD